MKKLNTPRHSMIADWLDQLHQLGLEAEVVPAGARDAQHGILRLARGGVQQHYALTSGPSVTLGSVGPASGDRPQFALTGYVAAKTADAFRRAGINYLDQAGNAWVEFGDVFIDVRGRPRPSGDARRDVKSGNLFSSGRAQVVFALLAWPLLWDAPQRSIALAAGVSVGQVNHTLRLLQQSGYSSDGGRRGQTDLLILWAAAFPTGLAQRLTLGRYAGTGAISGEWIGKTSESGAAAVPDLLRSDSAVYYVDDFDVRVAVLHKWRSDGELNITVRRRFWRDPDPAAQNLIAPWPLVYADLLASDDPRERAAAQEWRDRHARPQQRA